VGIRVVGREDHRQPIAGDSLLVRVRPDVALGGIVGGILRLFRKPVNLPRWMFWGSLLSLGLQGLKIRP
jgi:hypothetical protein